jgi:hypothetical protein
MMNDVASGKYVRMEVSSTDASAGIAVKFYNEAGTEVVPTSTQRVVIYDLLIVSAAGGDVRLVAITDAAGKRLVKGTLGTNGGIAMSYIRPVVLAKNVIPKLFAAAGQVDLTGSAEILDT